MHVQAVCKMLLLRNRISHSTIHKLITWHQWQRERVCTGGKTVCHFVKRAVTGTWEDLLRSFNVKLDALAKHQYIWIHQVKHCRALKNSLQPHEAVVHMNFSMNYACKMNTKIQSLHFGGCWKQATIHTVYTDGKAQAYATISNSLWHDERTVQYGHIWSLCWMKSCWTQQ